MCYLMPVLRLNTRIAYLYSFSNPPPQPTSTLFPYTTLFRSRDVAGHSPRGHRSRRGRRDGLLRRDHRAHRSEEHTSELQSRGHLVCRLLLEKKKKHEVHNGTLSATIEKTNKYMVRIRNTLLI